MRRFVAVHWKKGFGTGILGVLSYALALQALAIGNPAEIAALRETSVIFTALIGAAVLHERLGLYRTIATVLVLTGVLGLRFA